MIRVRYLALFGAFSAVAGTAAAQSTSGVFSPVVREGDLSAQYRLGLDPDSDSWSQRLHVQRALNTRFRLRGILQMEQDAGQGSDLDYVQGELLWQITPDGPDYQSALRFDMRIRPASEAELFRAIWSNQYDISHKWRLRGLVVTGTEFGDRAFDGVSFETRGRITYNLDSGQEIGVEVFNEYGTTEDVPGFEDQEHQIGPYTSFDIGENWSITAGTLFGVTNATDDINIRLWIGRAL